MVALGTPARKLKKSLGRIVIETKIVDHQRIDIIYYPKIFRAVKSVVDAIPQEQNFH